MKILKNIEFLEQLQSGQSLFYQLDIRLSLAVIIDLKKLNNEVVFRECFFKGEKITFISSEINDVALSFNNCQFFDNDIFFDNVECREIAFNEVSVHNILSIDAKNITKLSIREFSGLKSNLVLQGNIDGVNIFNSKCFGGIICQNVFCKFFAITGSYISDLQIMHCKYDSFNVSKNFFVESADHYTNFSIFETFEFSKNSIDSNFNFYGCTFSKITRFENLDLTPNSKFGIIDSTFNDKVLFDYSSLGKFKLINVDFVNEASFQETCFTEIDLVKIYFKNNVLFDQIEIRNINSCNRKTIRTIKQQLQKAENKIDYNRFRAYELHAYYRELNWKWSEGFRDKVVLGATILSTGFDHSWRRALGFTLGFGLLFYSLFFISVNHLLDWDLSNWREYGTGYFRFLIVTDLYSPLANGREYISNTNFLGWIVFILGKIFIAFGIYEMIQAFRKFKA